MFQEHCLRWSVAHQKKASEVFFEGRWWRPRKQYDTRRQSVSLLLIAESQPPLLRTVLLFPDSYYRMARARCLQNTQLDTAEESSKELSQTSIPRPRNQKCRSYT